MMADGSSSGLALLQPSITNFPFHVKKIGLQSCPGTTANTSERAASREQAALTAPSWQMSEEACVGRGEGGLGVGWGHRA